MNQWISNDSVNWRFNEPMHWWTSEPMNQWTNESMKEWVDESMDERMHEPTDPWFSAPMKQWINEPMNQWTHEPMGQGANQWRVDGWVSYYSLLSHFFTEGPLQWGTSSLSYFFSEQPLVWATSALSCLPASSFVASATRFYNAFSSLLLQSRFARSAKASLMLCCTQLANGDPTLATPRATLPEKTQGFMPESVCTREFRRFCYTSQLLVDDDDDVDVDVVDSVMWLTCWCG